VLNVHQHKNLYKFYFFSFDNISLFLPYLLTYKQIIHTEFVGYVYAVCTEHFTYQWYINLSLSNGNTEHKFHKPAMLLYILATPSNPPPPKKALEVLCISKIHPQSEFLDLSLFSGSGREVLMLKL